MPDAWPNLSESVRNVILRLIETSAAARD